MLRAFPLLIVLLVAGCKRAPLAEGEMSPEEEEFLVKVEERLTAYEDARQQALKDEQSDQKHALQRIADERRDVLERGVKANRWEARHISIAALGFSKKDDVLKHLVRGLEDSSSVVRLSALWAIAVLGSEATPTEPVVKFLSDPDPETRLSAMGALTKILRRGHDRGTYTAILGLLGDPEWRVRGQALLALANLGKRDSIKMIVEKSLKDDNTTVRSYAVLALAAIEHADSVDPLIGAMSDPDENVAEMAVNALERITGQKFGREPEQWAIWWKKRKEQGLGIGH